MAQAFYKTRMALDKVTNRRINPKSGFMMVTNNVLTRAGVDKYFGYEIPGNEELGLDPDRIYRVLRPPQELEKAVPTLNGLPILDEHNQDMDAENPMQELHVGAVGTRGRWEDPAIVNDLSFHDQKAIDDIKSGKREEVSCGYNYDVEIAPSGSTYNEEPYDLIMRNIDFNHVALVPKGRVEGAKVADSKPKGLIMALAKQTRRIAPNRGKTPLRQKIRKALDESREERERVARSEPRKRDGEFANDERELSMRRTADETIEEAEGSLIDAVAAIVESFQDHMHETPEGEITSEPIEEDNAAPVSATLDEEEFVAQVRDALETFAPRERREIAGSTSNPMDATLDEEMDLTGYTPDQLHGWIQRIEGELRNRSVRERDDVDVIGDEKTDLTPSTMDEEVIEKEEIIKKKGGQAMDAKMAVDAAVRKIKAATDAKNAAIALVEPLVGSVTKCMAMDSAEDVLRFALETHKVKAPKNVGLAGLHGMIEMLKGNLVKNTMAMDAAPERVGVEKEVADMIGKARARTRVMA